MEVISLKKQVELLERHLQKNKGKFTLADASAVTGVPIEQARQVLNQLMSKYFCHLQVTENGDLIYDFGVFPKRRSTKSFAEYSKDFQKWLWKVFVIFFKAWITVMLVVYFLIFLVIVVGIIVLNVSASKGERKAQRRDEDFSRLITDIFYAILRWQTIIQNTTHYEKDRYGYPYKTYNTKKKKFINAVYDFVFGPPRVEPDTMANQREVASYARKNKGVMVLSEFKALTGFNNEQAENLMTDCIARYNGSAEISVNGVLYADFYELTRSKTRAEDAPVVFYWDEYEPEYKLTGNSLRQNVGIAFMNAFNLAFATFFLLKSKPFEANVVFYGLGVIPFTFSVIFFAVPILRYFAILPKERQRRENNIRKRIVKVIYQIGSKKDLRSEEILAEVNRTNDLEKLSKVQVESMMHRIVIDWGGEAIPQADGSVLYSFPQMRLELAEIEEIRSKRKIDELGAIYFDTNN